MVARATSDTRAQCPQRSAVCALNNQSALNLSCNTHILVLLEAISTDNITA